MNSQNHLIVDKLIPGGMGIGTRNDGKKVMIWNALPGETITKYRIVKEKSSFIEAIAETINDDTKSPHRIQPADSCFLATSPWQNMNYAYELEQKGELLREILRQHQLLDIAERVGIPNVVTNGQDFHYRNKMEYSLYYSHDDKKIHLSFHARGSHAKIPITQSSLEYPAILARGQEIIAELNHNGDEARRYQSLLLRANRNGQVSGGLFENKKPHPKFPNLEDTILGYKYTYSPNGFFQINLPVYELALQEIKQYIIADKVLDLYAGVGTIGLSVARDKDLTLVEVDKSAFRELERNTKGTNAKAIYSKSEAALSLIAHNQTVIVDPPRAGLDSKLIDRFNEALPETIIYLSCNPVTQTRDVANLTKNYQLDKITPFNFFPRTPHLENLIILRRK